MLALIDLASPRKYFLLSHSKCPHIPLTTNPWIIERFL